MLKLRLNKSMQRYYFSVILVYLAVLSASSYQLWKSKFLNSEENSIVFEANYYLKKMNGVDPVQRIKKLIDQDRVSEAASALADLELRSKELNNLSPLPSFESYSKNLKAEKKYINKLLNYPSVSSLTSVLSNKITGFESFVKINGWRTLTRISKRVRARFNPSNLRSENFFDYSKFNLLYQSTMKDVDLMKKVTTGSLLKRNEKQIILSRLSSLSTEMNILKKYLMDLKSFDSSNKKLKASFDYWISKTSPEIMGMKKSFMSMSQYLIFFIIGTLGYFVLAAFIGRMVYRKNANSLRSEIELVAEKVISDYLVPAEGVDENDFGWSSEFKSKLKNFREYIHKRISFGDVFQGTVPFGTLLLDSNLKIVWANDVAYKSWGFDQKKLSDVLTWDFLQQFTNLGEDDPVQMALQQDIAGIYQIQLRGQGLNESLPYEMYISPTEYAGQKRIMIFLYPLRSLEETLNNQTKSIVSPIIKTIDALGTNKFSKEKKLELLKDFEIAGIGNIYEKFDQYNDFINQQRQGLLTEIESLENNLFDKIKLIDDIHVLNDDSIINNKKACDSLTSTKGSIIHNIDLRYDLESDFHDVIHIARRSLKNGDDLMGHSEKAQVIINENKKAFSNVESLKKELKTLKENLTDYRQRLTRSVDQTMIFAGNDYRSEIDVERLKESLGKIKLEMKGFEAALLEFSNVGQSLDVSLAKLAMTFEGQNPPDVSEYRNSFNDLNQKIDELSFSVETISQTGEKSDNVLISSLSNLFHAITKESDNEAEIEKLISQDHVIKQVSTQEFIDSSNA